MILRPHGEGVLAIGQPAHARLAADLAQAWAWPFAPRDEVILAALQHDIGMAAWDAEPVLDPATGLPYTFTSMPRAMHVGLWSRAARLVVAQSSYAALLVSMHGTGLYHRYVSERERSQEPARSYLEAEQAFQLDLAERLGADPGQLRRNAALLACWDWMSLFACTASSDRTTVEGVPEAADGRLLLDWRDREAGAIGIEPWPFAEPALSLSVEGRLLSGSFDDQAALREALAAAPILRVELTASA
jgi:uncharacterized protein DUF3891